MKPHPVISSHHESSHQSETGECSVVVVTVRHTGHMDLTKENDSEGGVMTMRMSPEDDLGSPDGPEGKVWKGPVDQDNHKT